MRTTDFSAAPPLGQATAMFTGATRYTGVRAVLTLTPTWLRMVRRMKAMPGYCWHTVYWERPLTLGTIAYFRTMDDLLAFARTPEHTRLMQWVTRGRRNATGGYIRIYRADPAGYSNGVWRAEGDEMGHIEEFSPIPPERRGPRVGGREGR